MMTVDELIKEINSKGYWLHLLQLSDDVWSETVRRKTQQLSPYTRGSTPVEALQRAWDMCQSTPVVPKAVKRERLR